MDHSLLSPLKSQQALEGLKAREVLRYLPLSVEQCRKEGNNVFQVFSELVRELEITFKRESAFLFNQLYKQVLRKIMGRESSSNNQICFLIFSTERETHVQSYAYINIRIILTMCNVLLLKSNGQGTYL